MGANGYRTAGKWLRGGATSQMHTVLSLTYEFPSLPGGNEPAELAQQAIRSRYCD